MYVSSISSCSTIFFPPRPIDPYPYVRSCRTQLPFHIQWQDLKDLFRAAGSVARADVALGPDGRSRGFGTVTLVTEDGAERARRLFDG